MALLIIVACFIDFMESLVDHAVHYLELIFDSFLHDLYYELSLHRPLSSSLY